MFALPKKGKIDMLLPFKLFVSRIPDSTNTPATLLAKSESFDILRKEKVRKQI